MTDRRLTPANGRVAAAELEGQVEAERFEPGEWRSLAAPLSDLLDSPGGRRDRQLLHGGRFRVLEERDGYAFGQCADGYVGYLASRDLQAEVSATHFVCVPATHAYSEPDFKWREVMALPFGARVRIVSASGDFFETDSGLFLPKPHLRPLNRPFSDMPAVAQLFFGAPYLWGGDTVWGIDCSGLVQAACLGCGIACPRDSDMQQAGLGDPVPGGAAPARGDLFFWEGHVAVAVDGETLIHANAHHMAVAYEPIGAAISRIAEQGGGPVTAHKRLPGS